MQTTEMLSKERCERCKFFVDFFSHRASPLPPKMDEIHGICRRWPSDVVVGGKPTMVPRIAWCGEFKKK